MGADTDAHDRLERPPERRAVDVGVKASDDTPCPESPHSLEAGRGGEPDERGQLLVRDPCDLLERGHKGAIGSVKSLSSHEFRILLGERCEVSNFTPV